MDARPGFRRLDQKREHRLQVVIEFPPQAGARPLVPRKSLRDMREGLGP
jgi:hypothetical protein